jgi:hypothetical protein
LLPTLSIAFALRRAHTTFPHFLSSVRGGAVSCTAFPTARNVDQDGCATRRMIVECLLFSSNFSKKNS